MSGYCDIIIIGDVKTMKDNRLFRILYYILEKGKVTASELADKFEVSVRTFIEILTLSVVQVFPFMRCKERVVE